MHNLIDYIKWRGGLSLEKSPLNEIDNLILARISYLPFEKINLNKKDTLSNLRNQFLNLKKEDYIQYEDILLVEHLSKSKRFKDLMLSDFFEKTDLLEEQQFAAITIKLPKNEIYVSYRGTDSTIVGWKEDFNMSFMINVPSQTEGVKYITKIAKKYPFKKIRIGGHSKGGNIAVYSGAFSNNKIKSRIIEITNADGPGFDSSIINKKEFNQIINKIHTLIPQSSIIGRVLEHEEKYEIVKSVQKGIMQHDIYSWEVEENKFVRISEMTNGSEVINKIIRDWLKNTTIEQRKNFINIIYDALSSTNTTSVNDFSRQILKNIPIITETYKNITASEKKEINKMLRLLAKSILKTLKEEIPSYLEIV